MVKKNPTKRASNRSKEMWQSRIADVSLEENKRLLSKFFESVHAKRRGKKIGNRTKDSYACRLVYFANWYGKPLDQVKDVDVDDFISDLENNGRELWNRRIELTPNTINNYKICIRAFYRWMVRRHKIEESPAKNQEIVMETKEAYYLHPDEVKAMYEASERLGPRTEAIIKTLFCTGIRANELISLCLTPSEDWNWINFNEGVIHINKTKSKGRRHFKILDWDALKPVLENYIQNFRVKPDLKQAPNNPLFTTRLKKGLGYIRMNELFRETVIESKIKQLRLFQERTFEDLTCHIARKTFATSYIRAGGDIIQLRYVMGHSSIKTTMIYLAFVRAEHDDSHTRIDLYSTTPKPQSEPQPQESYPQPEPAPIHAEQDNQITYTFNAGGQTWKLN